MTATMTRDPNFGHDPWLGPGTPVGQENSLGVRVYSGADTLAGDINLLPVGLDAYMSYVDNFGGWGELVARFGKTKALLISITIFGNQARCADVEPGAMHASDLPHWLDHVALRDGGQTPWVYTNAGNMGAVNSAIGNRPVLRWSAHVGFGPHLCGPRTCGFPQADWTQWVFTGPQGQNYDRSIGVVLPGPPPPPVDPLHYDWFDKGPFPSRWGPLNEQSIVEHYDGARQHPIRYKLYLKKLRDQLTYLAGRVYTVAHEQPINGQPSWGVYHRGWRYQMLIHRAQGKRFT